MTRPTLIASFTLAAALAVTAAMAQDAAPAKATVQATATSAPAEVAAPAGTPVTAPSQARKGDPARGKTLTFTCQGCHGVTGYKNAYPNYHVPLIGGQSEQYLAFALSEYRAGKRKHPTMQAQSQSFSEQDIADIAAYLASIK